MVRTLRPSGRAVVAVWIPAGAIDAMVGVFARAMAAATAPRGPRFAWHDERALHELAARHGADVQLRDGQLRIEAESPESYLTAHEQHPMSVAARPVLERAGTAEAASEQALAVLREGNEDPNAFRVTSRYRLIEVRPGK
jgi:hypothetical protein